ncbi:thermonuclease family protein [Rhizobium sp. Rhizsp42]|uniref:thermonuclease family protein n=1 Tax=Rhizobium sp. Rhizsp42 TaxID=3243034 RepID=UPI0039AF3EAA
MLSEEDVAYFRRRIGEVLQDERATEWQRQFLSDMRQKMDRYGVRTKVSEKQFAILKRLTHEHSSSPKLHVVTQTSTAPRQPRQEPAGHRYSSAPFERSPRKRSPFRVRDPFRPRNPFRIRNPFRPRYPFRSIAGAGRGSFLIVLGCILFVGLIGSFFGGGGGNIGSSSGPRSVTSAPSPTSKGQANFTITDGDTIRLSNGTRVRLVGFNTPEKFEPLCSNEAMLGNRASERLWELVGQATTTDVSLVACSCKPGTQGTKKCNYGRSCGKLEVDGRDVGQILISEGLAVPFVCGATGCPPTPRPWCG